MAPRRVSIVPHTHWDREWYAPFQTFRLRLVDVLDEFLARFEADETFPHFLLDGQMAVIDDYLAVRPGERDRLDRLARAGRLTMGPWYILMDEFLVSGETIVRNLQLGLERAAAFGGAMPVGYLPDMFGHIAQMPQLLRQAGIEHAVVWRGVPAAIDRTAFWWTAPDGSTVRAEYLPVGYGNGAAIADDPEALLRRLRAHDTEIGAFLGDGPMLLMNGTDHQAPHPWLGRVVAEAQAAQGEFDLAITGLEDHVRGGPVEGLPAWTGELRSGARAHLLMGVASNRVDVKQAAARAERLLEREAEPLAALYLDRWPGELLDEAWLDVIRNSAHDSICACSHDDVGVAVLHRYAEAAAIADGVADRAVASIARSLATAGTVVVNPSPHARSGLIEVIVPGEGELDDAQILHEWPSVVVDSTLDVTELRTLLGRIRGQMLDDTCVVDIAVRDEDDGTVAIVFTAHPHPRINPLVEAVKRDLYARLGAQPDLRAHVRVEQAPARRIVCRVEAVPGYGWQRWPAAPLTSTPVTVEGHTATNGLVTVMVDEATGTFAVDGVTGFGRIVESGDHGDTYNYSPPRQDRTVTDPTAVRVAVLEAGPIRARLSVTATFDWPESVDEATGERIGSVATAVRTVVEIRTGDPLVRVETTFDNRSCDHRVRALLPLPRPATASRAECAFAVVERGLTAEGGPGEFGLPTFPSRRFVQAGGLTVVHEGLSEYELVAIDGDGAHALALTLLRATGMLSRSDLEYRPLPAGPELPLTGPQSLGHQRVRYGLRLGPCDPFVVADEFGSELRVASGEGGGTRADEGTAFAVQGLPVSSLRRVGGRLEARVFNPGPDDARVATDRSGVVVDLTGAPVGPFTDGFVVGPGRIATARFD